MSDRPKPPEPEQIRDVLARIKEAGTPEDRIWAAWALNRIAELEDQVDDLCAERDRYYRALKNERGGPN